jgi:ribosomal protein S27AE
MATTQSGGVGKATTNTVKAMSRSAEKRQCPKCGRKSALKHYSDEDSYGTYCRWEDCGYTSIKVRPWEWGD